MSRTVRGTSDARGIALQAILDFEKRGAFVVSTVEELAKPSPLPPGDRGLAMELACGVVRRRLTLDAILEAYSTRPLEQIEVEMRAIIDLGIYQLLFLDRIPAHAAVHETVDLCHRLGKPRSAGFVNGILRNLQREVITERVTVQTLASCRRDIVPVPKLGDSGVAVSGVKLGRHVFPDPHRTTEVYLAEAFSLPEWLVHRWSEQYSPEEIFQYGAWFALPGTIHVRVNQLQTDVATCADVLRAAGVETTPGRFPESLRVRNSLVVENMPGFIEGWFSVQDESAMSAVDLLNPQSGEKVLDLCAAPGGKSTFIAERMRDTGSVLACDTSSPRLQLIEENVARLKLKSVIPQKIREDGEDIPEGSFDAVLLDVPCSNTGVLGKRPEARWRTSLNSLKELLPLQKRLLADALNRVRPGGRVVYSTCSIEPEENRGVVDAVLQDFPLVTLVTERHHVPGQPADGAYQAFLMKE